MSVSEQRVINLQKGLFGRKATEEEAIDMLTLEIEKIKGILAMAEGSIPASKKDMLSFALKDKELQLRILKESQQAKREAERLKMVAEEEAKAALMAKIAEEAKAAQEAKTEEVKDEDANAEADSEAKESEKPAERKEEAPKTSALI